MAVRLRRCIGDILLRGVAFGAALAIHIVFGLVLVSARDSTLQVAPSDRVQVIQVTLLSEPVPVPAPPLPPIPPLPGRALSPQSTNSSPSKVRNIAMPPTPSLTHSQQSANITVTLVSPSPAESSGGSLSFDEALRNRAKLFMQGNSPGHGLPRLPGKSHYTYQFVFTDPNTRGIKGIFKAISGITTPPSCIESRAHLHPNTVDPLVIGDDKRAMECVQPDGSVRH